MHIVMCSVCVSSTHTHTHTHIHCHVKLKGGVCYVFPTFHSKYVPANKNMSPPIDDFSNIPNMYLPLPPFICSPNCALFHLNLFRILNFSVFFSRSFSPSSSSFHLHLRHHQCEHLRKGASLWAIGVLRENPITIFRHSLPFIAALLHYCTIALLHSLPFTTPHCTDPVLHCTLHQCTASFCIVLLHL